MTSTHDRDRDRRERREGALRVGAGGPHQEGDICRLCKRAGL